MTSSELLDLAKSAAIAASNAIKRHYKSSFKVSFKSDSSPLTSADIAANEAIMQILKRSDIAICSEEEILDEKERTSAKTFWLVDPLDGTREFIDKNDEFCVCIALIEQDGVTLGVIMIPMSNEIFFASKDGVFTQILDENGKILHQSKLEHSNKNRQILYTGRRSKAIRERKIASEFDLNFTQLGSAIKFAKVVQNGGIYARFSKSSLWDIAAGEAIVKFSGGIMCDIKNFAPINYSAKSLESPKFIAISKENLAQKDEILALARELL
ncbi:MULTISPECIES: 3'(2'),5'-bisphosphate nucleotidase CysQ family protein [unclassified Campylobacter]|uniref:3'(2'),5'-bisphosphate nucleotidase CysQ family protein n=1 Tax=unclassified Campylobacter TaxID=2593542 RepID=UPI003D342726